MSVTAAAGFAASGVAAGIKPGAVPDLALVAATGGRAVAGAGCFTSNRAPAAPVEVSRAHLRATAGLARAVVVNSGNANAATGDAGRSVARETCSLVAELCGGRPEEVLVCSTGLIGTPLPWAPLERGVRAAVRELRRDASAGRSAAEAIMTTDSRTKEVLVERNGWRLGGMAKGAAMLSPRFATMLAVLTTDASVEPSVLQHALADAVEDSFGALSVDGCPSTNDTVLCLASGAAGVAPTGDELLGAAREACRSLAEQMAEDAEGATKVVRVVVRAARDVREAAMAARAVAENRLVQASLHGADPYWGRVVAALGVAGVAMDPEVVRVAYGGIVVCERGVALAHDERAVAAHMAGRRVLLEVDLGVGEGRAEVLTTDLSARYVELNASTS